MKRKYFKYTKDYMIYLTILAKYNYTASKWYRYKTFKEMLFEDKIDAFNWFLRSEKSIYELKKKETEMLGAK